MALHSPPGRHRPSHRCRCLSASAAHKGRRNEPGRGRAGRGRAGGAAAHAVAHLRAARRGQGSTPAWAGLGGAGREAGGAALRCKSFACTSGYMPDRSATPARTCATMSTTTTTRCSACACGGSCACPGRAPSHVRWQWVVARAWEQWQHARPACSTCGGSSGGATMRMSMRVKSASGDGAI